MELVTRLPLILLCQIYLVATLLASAIMSPLPYPLVSLLLLVAMLLTIFYPSPRSDIVMILATVLLLPQILSSFLVYLSHTTSLSPAVPQTLAVVAAMPALYLLDCALRRNASEVTVISNGAKRLITPVSRALFTSCAIILTVSVFLDNRVLLLTSTLLGVYLLATLLLVLKNVPGEPINAPATGKRIVADTSGSISVTATARTGSRLFCYLSPVDSWVKVVPQKFTAEGTGIELALSVTPPLAGLSNPRILVSAIDTRGFLQTNQVIEPLELQVIPRAKYAEWLARRYLEQTGTKDTISSTVHTKTVAMSVSGTEYYDNRTYQPGDRLKDIEWRHTIKLQQLITKQYISAGGQSAIIAVNLSVADAEGADRLAFNMITTALTLAQHAVPIALTAYNHKEVIVTLPATHPEETLRQILTLVKDIVRVAVPEYYLEPPDVKTLKRSISQLKQASSQPAKQLLGILNLEYQAIYQTARNSPATSALNRVVSLVTPPAIIILVSQLNNNPEALTITTGRLEGKGFSMLTIRDEE